MKTHDGGEKPEADVLAERLAELEANEDRLKKSLQLSATAFCHHDRNLRYTWIYNPHMGFTPEQVLGKTDWEILEPELADRMGAYKRQVLETGIGMRVDVPTRLDDPTAEVFDLTIVPLWDHNGAVTGLSCSGVNVTEAKRAEAARQRRDDMLTDLWNAAKLENNDGERWSAWVDAMDMLSIGVMLVDGNASLSYANNCAKTILDVGCGVKVTRGKLCTESLVLNKTLYAAIREAIAEGTGAVSKRDRMVIVPRSPEQRSLSLFIFAQGAHQSKKDDSAALAVIYVSNPDREHIAMADKLAKLYGLTPGESRLTEALIKGESIKEYAQRNGVSVNTVRSQLKQVFGKTGVKRQSDLVRDILSSPILWLNL